MMIPGLKDQIYELQQKVQEAQENASSTKKDQYELANILKNLM